MVRALKLDRALYREVEHDPKASAQGLIIIVIVSVFQAAGRFFDNLILGLPLVGLFSQAIAGFLETVIGLAIWSYLLYFIGTKVFKGVATPQEVWRTTSFARSPGIFFIIPFIGTIIASVWILIAYFIAAKEALDLSTGRTLAAALISFLPFLVLQSLVVLVLRTLF